MMHQTMVGGFHRSGQGGVAKSEGKTRQTDLTNPRR